MAGKSRFKSRAEFIEHRKRYLSNYRKTYRLSSDFQRRHLEKTLRKQYGITLEQYEEIVKRQDGRCAICQSRDFGSKNRKRMFVDHNHETSKVRGLLCNRCNTGLGLFNDDPVKLKAAMEYLEKNDG